MEQEVRNGGKFPVSMPSSGSNYLLYIIVLKVVTNIVSFVLVSSNRILSSYQYFNHETNQQRTTPSFEMVKNKDLTMFTIQKSDF